MGGWGNLHRFTACPTPPYSDRRLHDLHLFPCPPVSRPCRRRLKSFVVHGRGKQTVCGRCGALLPDASPPPRSMPQ